MLHGCRQFLFHDVWLISKKNVTLIICYTPLTNKIASKKQAESE